MRQNRYRFVIQRMLNLSASHAVLLSRGRKSAEREQDEHITADHSGLMGWDFLLRLQNRP